MKKRSLCFVCLVFLVVRGILLILTSGDSLVKIPASSIFYRQGEKAEVLVQGRVYKKTNTSKIQVLYLKNNSISNQNNTYYESNILIYDNTFTEIPIGKTICVRGQINQFEKARNPGNFEQQLYYAKQNIYGYVWCEKIMFITGEENEILERLHQLRQAWNSIFTKHMSEENGAVLGTMLLGEKSGMDAETKELYQKNGISHVLAISGLHISFIGLGIYRLFRKAGVSYPGAGILSLLLLSTYVMMIGFSVSVVRAYVMLLLRIGADIVGRVYDMLTALLVAAAILVVYQPLYLTDAGFYMSHGAILGILLILPEIKKMLPQRPRWLEGAYASIAINITLFPVLLWFYFEFSAYSFILNIIVIPLMSWVLGFGMFGSVTYLVCKPVGVLLLKICDYILYLFSWLGEIGVKLPFASIVLGQPNWWEVMLYYVLLLVLIFILRKCKKETVMRKGRKFGFVFAVIAIVMFVKFPDGKLQVTMLDVGQGDCIFLKGPTGNTYLFDGGSSDVESVGKYRIEPFLKSQGVGTLDYVFVSHGDADHYNGIGEMIERQALGVRISMLVLPANCTEDEKLLNLAEVAKKKGVKVVMIDAGEVIIEGKLQIQCLQPEREEKELEGNAGSMVLDVSFGKFDMLFTGDVEENGEELLKENLAGKSYDVLKVAHHGSMNSTDEAFLEITKPRISLISAGIDNFYGHPHEETIKRLKKIQSKIYQTAESGAVTLKTNGEFIDIFPSSI